jgi:hypothetical protein
MATMATYAQLLIRIGFLTRMDANTRKWLMKNCAASWALEKYQVSGFQVSGVRVQSFLVT